MTTALRNIGIILLVAFLLAAWLHSCADLQRLKKAACDHCYQDAGIDPEALKPDTLIRYDTLYFAEVPIKKPVPDPDTVFLYQDADSGHAASAPGGDSVRRYTINHEDTSLFLSARLTVRGHLLENEFTYRIKPVPIQHQVITEPVPVQVSVNGIFATVSLSTPLDIDKVAPAAWVGAAWVTEQNIYHMEYGLDKSVKLTYGRKLW